jgi:DNA-binding MarR family transcriptional regulator
MARSGSGPRLSRASATSLAIYDVHIYISLMSDARTTNLLGAAVTALNDELEAATASAAEHGAAFPAALVSVHWAPGLSIERLRRILGLSHSGTVRLLDRLEREGAVERKAGRDGRSVAVHLTAQGRRHVRTILDRRRSVMGSALPGGTGSAASPGRKAARRHDARS